MDDKFLRTVLSRVFHDLMSPMSAVSLAVESMENSIQDQAYDYINSSLDDFKSRVSVFRILTLDDGDKVETRKIVKTLEEEAKSSNIQVSLSGFPTTSSGKLVKMATHLFILSNKIAVKDGTIKISLLDDMMQSEAASKRCIDITREILDASHDLEMLSLNSRNVENYWAIKHASEAFSSKIDLLPSRDGWSLIVPF